MASPFRITILMELQEIWATEMPERHVAEFEMARRRSVRRGSFHFSQTFCLTPEFQFFRFRGLTILSPLGTFVLECKTTHHEEI